jgi:hypothetical protein
VHDIDLIGSLEHVILKDSPHSPARRLEVAEARVAALHRLAVALLDRAGGSATFSYRELAATSPALLTMEQSPGDMLITFRTER